MAETVASLLLHFWTPSDDPRVRARVAEDWLTDLAEFGPEIVKDACAEWRRDQNRRPTPADVRRICIEMKNSRETVYRPTITPEQRAQIENAIEERNRRFRDAAEWRQKFAESKGFKNFDAVMKYGIVAAFKLPDRAVNQ